MVSNFMTRDQAKTTAGVMFADYNKDIFWTYINDPDELGGVAEFKFSQSKIESLILEHRFNFELNFIRGREKVELELMERCENGKTVWTTLQTHYVRDSQISLQTVLYQQGPNKNGHHFLEHWSMEKENQLKSLALTDLFLRSFEDDDIFLPTLMLA